MFVALILLFFFFLKLNKLFLSVYRNLGDTNQWGL